MSARKKALTFLDLPSQVPLQIYREYRPSGECLHYAYVKAPPSWIEKNTKRGFWEGGVGKSTPPYLQSHPRRIPSGIILPSLDQGRPGSVVRRGC